MSVLSDIVQLLRQGPDRPALPISYGAVTDIRGDDPLAVTRPVAPAGKAYFRWRLQEMHLHFESQWLSHYRPMVYGSTKLRFGDQDLELPVTVDSVPLELDGDVTVSARTLILGASLTPLLPFNGGEVQLGVVMIGVRFRDGLKDLMSAVAKLGNALMVPQLSAVMAFAVPISDTIALLANDGDRQLKLGFQQTYSAESAAQLRAGYFLVAGAKDLAMNEYCVVNSRLAYANNPTRLVEDFDYMLLRLEIVEHRDDVHELTAIQSLVRKAQEAANNDAIDQARAYIRAAQIEAWNSPDLTLADRRIVPKAINDDFTSFLASIGGGAEWAPDDSATLESRISEVTPDDALSWTDNEVDRIVFGE